MISALTVLFVGSRIARVLSLFFAVLRAMGGEKEIDGMRKPFRSPV